VRQPVDTIPAVISRGAAEAGYLRFPATL